MKRRSSLGQRGFCVDGSNTKIAPIASSEPMISLISDIEPRDAGELAAPLQTARMRNSKAKGRKPGAASDVRWLDPKAL